MSKSERPTEKSLYDYIPYVMLSLVIAAVVSGAWVYTSYKSSFGDVVQPRSVQERGAAERKEPPKEASAEGEARAEWGQLGDYFGGTLNPIFGFISVLGLFLTILYQSREMQLSTEELRKSAEALATQNKAIQKQSFEQSFFAWLGTYREILGEIQDPESDATGRTALIMFWRRGLSSDVLRPDQSSRSELRRALFALGLDEIARGQREHFPQLAAAAAQEWDHLYLRYETHLDNVFRVLYRLIRWIDEQPPEQLNEQEKWHYVSIVRSQLSWIEMVFLFYNGMTSRGEKFKGLANRYALFDNLTPHSDALLVVLRENPMDGKGYMASAFSSDEARRALAAQPPPS